MKESQKEYENYITIITDKFLSFCSMHEYYLDYCNDIIDKNPDTRFRIFVVNEHNLLDMSLDGSFENDGARKKY